MPWLHCFTPLCCDFFALHYHDDTQRTAPIDWYEVMFLLFSSNI